MPGRNGTGPFGQGSGTGRGMGRGKGGGGRPGAGPGGNCVCPNCGEKASHRPGVPCTSVSCPKCNTQMVRE